MENVIASSAGQQGRDCAWVSANYGELSTQYPNEWVIVRQKRVIYHGLDLPDDAFDMGLVTFISDGWEIL